MLYRLDTYIDVLPVHRLDHDTPPEEIMRALNDVIDSGKVRYIGASSMAAWELQMLNNVAEKHRWHKFIRSVTDQTCTTKSVADCFLACKTITTSFTARKTERCTLTATSLA